MSLASQQNKAACWSCNQRQRSLGWWNKAPKPRQFLCKFALSAWNALARVLKPGRWWIPGSWRLDFGKMDSWRTVSSPLFLFVSETSWACSFPGGLSRLSWNWSIAWNRRRNRDTETLSWFCFGPRGGAARERKCPILLACRSSCFWPKYAACSRAFGFAARSWVALYWTFAWHLWICRPGKMSQSPG